MNAKPVLIMLLLVSLLTGCDTALTSQITTPDELATQPSVNLPSTNLELPGTIAPVVPQITAEPVLPGATAYPPVVPQITAEPVRPVPTANPPVGPSITAEPERPVPSATSRNQAVLDRASEAMLAISKMDMATLSSYVHPAMGLRISPYSFVHDTDLVFSAAQVAALPASSQVYHWGSNAGSDAPIDMSFPDYYKDFIYDVDFLNAPEMSLNHRLGGGSTIDNARDFYKGSMVVEYYFPGFDAQYQGMDWRGLRLVLVEYNNNWYLVGIIHDEWTP